MSIRSYKPTTPGRRGMTTQDLSSVTTKKPLKSLISIKKAHSGRNNQGKITVRHRGGGARRFYRHVNFNLPNGSDYVVEAIEYDPNRSARIARIKDQADTHHYILAGSNMKPGKKISVGVESKISAGNRLPLEQIPAGSQVYAIEIQPGKGAQMVRSAGTTAQLMSKEGNYAQLRLPSGEVRLISLKSQATIGTIGNDQHQNIKIGKAGRKRHKGFRPSVRGVVMNAVDHPHGGGDGGRHGVGGGKTHGTAPKTPWGQKTLGYKTRKRKTTNKYIARSRHLAKRRKG